MKTERVRQLLVAEQEAIRRLWRFEEGRRQDEAEADLFTELSSTDQHPADAASETLEAEVDATIFAMAEDRLADVELAFARLATGTYGTCETCGALIDDDRLEAQPAAWFCITHERAWELRQIDLSVPAVPMAATSDVQRPVSLESLPIGGRRRLRPGHASRGRQLARRARPRGDDPIGARSRRRRRLRA